MTETAQPAIQAPPATTQTARQPIASPSLTPAETDKAVAAAPAESKKLHDRTEDSRKPLIEEVTTSSKPVESTTNTVAAGRQGWTCQSSDQKTNWNCNQVDSASKGQPQVAAETESLTPSVLSETYDQRQERTFQILRSEFTQDPWQNCSNWAAKNKKISNSGSAQSRDSATTLVDADSSEIFDGEVLNFAGSVDLHRGDQHLMADKASYDTVSETMDAQGNVLYSDAGMALSSETVSISMDKDEARLRDSQFIIAAAPLRGAANTVYRDNKDLSRYQDVSFTSCPPGNQDWIGHAAKLKVNRETGQGSAKNAWVEFKGVPVLYTPYVSFPTDDRRMTGLLAPTFGSSQRNGFDASAPFYWNIAPNFDDVITPRYMERRGAMLMNKFRYLTGISEGELRTDILPNDDIKGKSRYLGSFKDRTTFSPNLHTLANLNFVSDKEYFNDLNNPLGFQNNRFLPSTASLNYARPDISFVTGFQHYQSVDKTIDNRRLPYDVLPKVGLNYDHQFENLPINVALHNQFAHFYNEDRVNGQRLNIAPSISVPLESSAGFFIPKITGQFTQYNLSNQGDYFKQDQFGNLLSGVSEKNMPSSVSRMLPIFSVDSGMIFERDMQLGKTPYTNTLEPRAFYLYIPRKDQSNIPLFDTAAYDTNFYSLFRENKYSGLDRVQDANQITLAASSRFINSETGLEPLKVSLGQIIYFQDRLVDLDYNGNYENTGIPTSNPAELRKVTSKSQTSSNSNFIGEISGQINRELSYSTGTQWDPENNSFARNQFALKYRNNLNQVFNIGYRYRRSLPTDQSLLPNELPLLQTDNPQELSQQSISQSDISFRLPIYDNWYGLGRWQYSFNFDKTSESFIGLEKESCCWRLRLIGRRYLNGANFASVNPKPENAVFVQLELKGFTSFGDSVDNFLQRNLNGYRAGGYYED